MTRWELRRGAGWLLLGGLFVLGSLGVRSQLAPDGSAATEPEPFTTPPTSADADGQPPESPRTPSTEPLSAVTDEPAPPPVEASPNRGAASPAPAPTSQADRSGEVIIDTAALSDAEQVAAAWVTEYATTHPDEPAADYRTRLEPYGTPELVEAVTSAEALEEAAPSTAVTVTVAATQPATVDEERIAVLVTAQLEGEGMPDGDHELMVVVVFTEEGYRVAEVVL